MADESDSPFDSIDGAYGYVQLLGEAVRESIDSVDEAIGLAEAEGAARRLEALRLVNFKQQQLMHHMHASRKLLNDLRTLRRLLLGERAP